jgi:hypothetical protein
MWSNGLSVAELFDVEFGVLGDKVIRLAVNAALGPVSVLKIFGFRSDNSEND